MDMELNYEPTKLVAVPVGEESILNEEVRQQIEAIPERLAFKIGEVADLVGVKSYVLRYWESEFEVLNPKKSKNNQRVYQRRDVEYIYVIKKLLYSDKYSIEGAKAALRRYRKQGKKAQALLESRSKHKTIITRAQLLIDKIEKCINNFDKA